MNAIEQSIQSKVVPLEALRDKRGTLVHGCFDLLHYGHMRYFAWAKALMPGNPLIATLTSDRHFPKHKGNYGPAFPQNVRAAWIAYVGIVDWVAIVDEPTGVLAIETIRPEIYCKGPEAVGLIPQEEFAVTRYDGKVEFMPKETTDGKQVYSSGSILDGNFSRKELRYK